MLSVVRVVSLRAAVDPGCRKVERSVSVRSDVVVVRSLPASESADERSRRVSSSRVRERSIPSRPAAEIDAGVTAFDSSEAIRCVVRSVRSRASTDTRSGRDWISSAPMRTGSTVCRRRDSALSLRSAAAAIVGVVRSIEAAPRTTTASLRVVAADCCGVARTAVCVVSAARAREVSPMDCTMLSRVTRSSGVERVCGCAVGLADATRSLCALGCTGRMVVAIESRVKDGRCVAAGLDASTAALRDGADTAAGCWGAALTTARSTGRAVAAALRVCVADDVTAG